MLGCRALSHLFGPRSNSMNDHFGHQYSHLSPGDSSRTPGESLIVLFFCEPVAKIDCSIRVPKVDREISSISRGPAGIHAEVEDGPGIRGHAGMSHLGDDLAGINGVAPFRQDTVLHQVSVEGGRSILMLNEHIVEMRGVGIIVGEAFHRFHDLPGACSGDISPEIHAEVIGKLIGMTSTEDAITLIDLVTLPNRVGENVK